MTGYIIQINYIIPIKIKIVDYPLHSVSMNCTLNMEGNWTNVGRSIDVIRCNSRSVTVEVNLSCII